MTGAPVGAAAIGGGLVAALAGLIGWRRHRRATARIGDEAAAMAAARAALPGFAPVAAVVADDGAAALVSGGAGADRLALLRAAGRRLVAREVDWAAVRATRAGIVVETGERRVGPVPLAGVDALDVRRLAPAASAPPP